MRTKHWISLLLCLLMCVGLFPMAALADGDRYLEINEANFPDAIFRQWVKDNLAGGKDYMTQAEVEGVTYISASGKGIASLKGVEHFTALEDLSCYNNQLTTLDVSHNTALEELWCSDNQLATLDVSHNTALEDLDCSDNQLTTLDVSHNTALEYLHCYRNQLTTLDVSHNTALKELYCYDNQLTALDVSHSTTLEDLDCSDNKLTILNVSHNTALEDLDCSENQLTTLDVSHIAAIESLSCWDNKLTTLDVSHNTALEDLDCSYNQLASINLSKNTKLDSDDCCCDGQELLNQKLLKSGTGFTYDLGRLVINPSKVTVTTEDVNYKKSTGIVTFADYTDFFEYEYDTGRGKMEVTVYFIEGDVPVAPPTITAQPKDVNVKNGEQATFTVKATGDGNIEYQWFSRPTADSDWVLVDGATSDTYTVVGTKDNNGWQFRCSVKNEGGEVYSEAATLTVTQPAPPTIKTQPKGAKVKSGSKAKFTVKAKEKGVSYQWLSMAPEAADWTELSGETKGTLTVVATKANSGTQYRCRVRTAEGGEAFSNPATLTVKIQPPVIKTPPKSLAVVSGKKAKFTVKASGPKLTYTWYSRPNAEGEWTSIAGQTKKDLSIVASKANDGSQYYCHIQNADGEADTAVVTLTVTPQPPTIKTQPKDAKVKIGAKAKFKVKASGKNVTYQWYYRTSETGEWVLLDGATAATYTVIATEGNIGWQFRCLAKNADGQAYSKPATLRQK